MIIVDFGIICIGQKECTYPEPIEDIRFEAHRREPDSEAMYRDDSFFDLNMALQGKLKWNELYFIEKRH